MKKLLIVVLCVVFIISMAIFCGCGSQTEAVYDCVRIHIRANSNVEADQNLKMKVVAEVVAYLTPMLAECENGDDAKQSIGGALAEIEKVADSVLAANGVAYLSTATLTVEDFPARQYSSYLFPDGTYDALIIELGEGSGDNWWCVAFPPLCFVPTDDNENFEYKSKIVELIKKYFGGDDEQNN